jgi:hypothetical protein
VESVASGIALSKDEGLCCAVPPIEAGSGVDDFKEDGNHVDRVCCRARAVVVRVLCRIGHVRFVIGTVEVLAVPAGGEENLSAHAVGANSVGQTAVVRRLAVVIEADKADGLTGKVTTWSALERVTGEHAEVLGVSSEVVVVGTTSLKVVYQRRLGHRQTEEHQCRCRSRTCSKAWVSSSWTCPA